ncbi:hypothetical protein B0P06_005844 [Clostridium saccharoperbutylacetonicum]|uniref:Transposase n=1 Tax=Clostridium saccharoperbutylacetonicum N1-4(HMT) TaxID=931276 RepID=M1MMC4_9CLOT|nr:hypothetical protein Cspa_c21350 [Clostridium saccharoperbutylacetonicum N1-4(HMT)]NRT63360.1 hypothetical protein [Clostridium saccharoperbutylacetonicum]NSB26722.1 hypothetical protein [Clostridium saccharoperbutylacetonicum]NSB46073.1 hypothetical protein [Clostridium saccharoperbutylacetonicum]
MESILRAVKLIKDIVKNKIQREKLCRLNSKVKQMRTYKKSAKHNTELNIKNLRIHSHLRFFYRTAADKKLRKNTLNIKTTL